MLAILALTACGAGPVARGSAPPGPDPEPDSQPSGETRAPQSLQEGMAALGLTALELESREEHATSFSDAEQVGDEIRLIETRGFSHSSSTFARRADGSIVLVRPTPRVIVDRHVDGGCLTFAGGRAWHVRVTYTLPPGATYGGEVPVSYEEHTEVVDHQPTQPDGSPCPPPAID